MGKLGSRETVIRREGREGESMNLTKFSFKSEPIWMFVPTAVGLLVILILKLLGLF